MVLEMATVPSSYSTSSPSPLFFLSNPLTLPIRRRPTLSFTNRATNDDDSSSFDSPETPDPTQKTESESEFEARLAQLRLRNKSGTGKKAEARKSRKSKKGSSSGGNLYLPPVPLKEPVSGRLKVDFGFTPYSERINGRIAMLGLSALLLVELATGKSVINYHTPSIV